MDLLFSLTDPGKDGEAILKTAFCFCSDAYSLNHFAIPFLGLLGKEDLYKGTCRPCIDQCYRVIYRVPGFLACIYKELKESKLEKPSIVAWFIKTLACEDPEVRENTVVKDIAQLLAKDTSVAVRELITVLFPSMREQEANFNLKNMGTPESLNDLQAWEPQHDNDHPFDYRSIQILPTAEELNSPVPPSFGVGRLWTEESLEDPEGKVAVALDRQFRLLRSDMTIPMKKELAEEWKVPVLKRRRIFNSPRLIDVSVAEKGVSALLIDIEMPTQLRGRLKKLNQKARSKFFEEAGRRVLARESVLLFLSKSSSGEYPVVDSIGLITRREPKELLSKDGDYLRVGVSFEANALQKMLHLLEISPGGGKKGSRYRVGAGKRISSWVYQASSSFFSYKPVLERLQRMSHIPFADEFIHRLPSPAMLDETGEPFSTPDAVKEKLSSDPSQQAAVEYALNHRVALIQGPPGTGKTFCGVQLAQALLASNPRHRILCLCYTNHALDDFLLSIHEDGLDLSRMIRLGRSPKIHDKLKGRCLGDLSEHAFDRLQNRRFAILKDAQRECKDDLIHVKENLTKRQWGPKWWRTAGDFLRRGNEAQEEAWKELQLPSASHIASLGMKTVGKSGKKGIGEEYLWEKWCGGAKREGLLPDAACYTPSSGVSVWAVEREERRSLMVSWQEEWIGPKIERAASLMKRLESLDRDIAVLRAEAMVPTARKASIIGCTTTAAAKNNDLLEQIKPTVVIIEEAAEILEANVLTALGDSVEQCFMIGDHKQLRPKLDTYDLRQESGKGVDFDVSLFERLATQPHFPVHTLKVQHRMRPEISALIRTTTYPDLQDHPSVLNRASIRGLSSNVVFFSHDQYETNDEENAILGVNSKINLYEVEMVVCVLRYLLQQGYKQSEITVLTPYLGQLVQIRNTLRRSTIDVSLGDLDKSELKKVDPDADVNNKNGSHYKKGSGEDWVAKTDDTESIPGSEESSESESCDVEPETVRVATVDNFQGEEARIIIGSLVRSNADGDIGFVGGAERVNVLLSRARDGLILLGNTRTLRNARSASGRKVWTGVLDLLEQQNHVFSGLPVRCERHRSSPEKPLSCSDDFVSFAPDGGCCEPCGVVLPSCPFQHTCPLKCHPCFLSDAKVDVTKLSEEERRVAVHKNMYCRVNVQERCPATKDLDLAKAHLVTRICCETSAKPCLVTIVSQCSEGHIVFRKCGYPSHDSACSICAQIRRDRRVEELAMKERVRVMEELELTRLRLAQELQEERIRLADQISLDRIKEETVLLKDEISLVQGHLINTAEKKDTRTPIDEKLISSRPISDNVAVLYNEPQDQQEQPNLAESSTDLTHPSEIYREKCSNEDQELVPINITMFSDQEVESCSPPAELNSDQDSKNVGNPVQHLVENQNSVQLFKTMMKSAVDEDWIALFPLVEANCSKTDVGGITSKLFKVLINLHLIGYDQDLLSQTEAIVKMIQQRLKISMRDRLLCLAHYTSFVVSERAKGLEMTAVKHATAFLAFSQSVDFPQTWKDRATTFCAKTRDTANISTVKTATRIRSSASEDWDQIKASTGKTKASPSPAVDKLMSMTGLESIKRNVVNQYHRIVLAQEQGSAAASSYNTRFEGNPGTGKTTVARFYSQFLKDVGVLPVTAVFRETTGSQLISTGVKGLKDILEEAKKAGGGVVFVDEAYQLNPQSDQQGRQVLDFLLVHAEKMKGAYGDLVWIFAGYKRDMEKMFEHNQGLPSRFPNYFLFEDYSDEELLLIFSDILWSGGVQENLTLQTSEAKTSRPVNKTLAMPNNRFSTRPDETDRWGNLWRWDVGASTFVDDYDNVTGYGAANLGTPGNPLVSRKDNTMWCFNFTKTHWYLVNNPSITSKTYPGKPLDLKPVSKAIHFSVSNEKWSRIAVRRVGRLRGTVGFGNARAIRTLFDNTRSRQADRITQARLRGMKPNIFQFERDDLLGPRVDRKTIESCEAYQQLQRMEGLQEVKQSVNRLLELVLQNADREDAEKPILGVALNKVFLGNPGTGKTTVAKLYASILAQLGLLSKGEVILKNSSDFVGSALGQSEKVTRGILKQAEGSVLVIDEAYGLNPAYGGPGGGSKDPYKMAVIDTIVEQVQGVPGEDRAVVLLGYRKEMEEMMAQANPGLSRRFQMEQAFEFKDYDDAALLRILRATVQRDGLNIDLSTSVFAVKKLARARAGLHFGNAGAVNNLLSEAKLNFQSRNAGIQTSQRKDQLISADFCVKGQLPMDSAEEDIFSDLSDCEQILRKLREYRNTINLAKQQGKDPKKLVEFNFLFVGSPGTGKTTIARKMGTLFHSLGLLPTDECLEITASDFITGFTGQAAKKTEEVMRSARGKVLFIDEAYQLNPRKGGHYMQEVVDAMVQALTSKELVGQMVVVLAGYEGDIDEMLKVNQGLRSRFSEKLLFPDFAPQKVSKIIRDSLVNEYGLSLPSEVDTVLSIVAQRLTEAPNFGNGRDCNTLSKRIFRELADRVTGSPDMNDELIAADLEKAVEKFIEGKLPTTPTAEPVFCEFSQPPLEMSSNHYTSSVLNPVIHTNIEMKTTEEILVDDNVSNDVEGHHYDTVDPFLVELQNVLDDRGLNSQEGVLTLSTLDIDSPQMINLINELAELLGISTEEATEKVRGWRESQEDVKNKLEEQEKECKRAKREGRKALVPVWRCGVCGRADKPFIVCYVQPFIVKYTEIEV